MGQIIQLIDSYTKENVNYEEVTTWYDGTPMDDGKVDNVIYRKKGSKYFKLCYTDPINVRWFGAKGDGVTDDTHAFNACLSFCVASKKAMLTPNGTYLLSPINFGYTNLKIYGDNSVYRFVGTGTAFNLKSSELDYVVNQYIENLVIEGNANTSVLFNLDGAARSIYRNIELRECNAIAARIGGAVSCLFENIKYSASYHTTKASERGILITRSTGSIGYSADNTFINLISEDFPALGLYLENASGNKFIGGTFEGLSKGVVISSVSRLNTFSNIWMEANSIFDFEDGGKNNTFINVNAQSASSDNYIASTSSNSTIINGYIRSLRLESTSVGTLLLGCSISDHESLGINGSGPVKMLGVTRVNDSGTVTSILSDRLNASGLFEPILKQNNINLAITNVSAIFNQVGNKLSATMSFSASEAGTSGEYVFLELPDFLKSSKTLNALVGTAVLKKQNGEYVNMFAVSNVAFEIIFHKGGLATGYSDQINPGDYFMISLDYWL